MAFFLPFYIIYANEFADNYNIILLIINILYYFKKLFEGFAELCLFTKN